MGWFSSNDDEVHEALDNDELRYDFEPPDGVDQKTWDAQEIHSGTPTGYYDSPKGW